MHGTSGGVIGCGRAMGGIDTYFKRTEPYSLPYRNGVGKGSALGSHGSNCAVSCEVDYDCDGSGILNFNGRDVHFIDGYWVVITHVRGPWATGEIIKNDLTTQPCYIGRVGGHYAVAGTLKEVYDTLRETVTSRKGNLEDIADVFVEAFPDLDKEYKWGDMLFVHSLHPYSCEQGRTNWSRMVGRQKTDMVTVREFLDVAEDSVARALIRTIKEKYMYGDR